MVRETEIDLTSGAAMTAERIANENAQLYRATLTKAEYAPALNLEHASTVEDTKTAANDNGAKSAANDDGQKRLWRSADGVKVFLQLHQMCQVYARHRRKSYSLFYVAESLLVQSEHLNALCLGNQSSGSLSGALLTTCLSYSASLACINAFNVALRPQYL